MLTLADKYCKNRLQCGAILSLLVRESSRLTLVDLGKVLNRDAAGLSHLASRFVKRCKKSEKLKMEIDDLKNSLFTDGKHKNVRMSRLTPRSQHKK